MRHVLGSLILAVLAGPASLRAQIRLTVDPIASLAWWQINPHMNHLWATTCPAEPSWRAVEGRSSGWFQGTGFRPPKHADAGINDTTLVPLYPRYEALSVCTEGVVGQVLVADTVRWRGVRGEVSVKADSLVSGDERRDLYTRRALLQTTQYPEIRFTIDSLVNVTRHADTIRGTAVGVLDLHGVKKPMNAGVQAWPELGGLRVLGRLRLPALALTEEFGLSRFGLGLGVNTRIWYDLFMGVDVVLRPHGGS